MLYLQYMGGGGRGWLKTSYERRVAEKSKYRHVGGGGLKVLKNRHL